MPGEISSSLLQSRPVPTRTSKLNMSDLTTWSHNVFPLCIVLALFFALFHLKKREIGRKSGPQCPFTIDKPFILPGRISHTRLFPQFHSFSYPYLMVGIPVGSTFPINSVLSVDQPTWWKRGWLCVEAKDHLGRGGNEFGIRRKLELYLESQV